MDAAEQLAAEESESLSWAEICTRYPEQFVCLIDIAAVELGSPEILSARVVGHGSTRGEAFAPIRDLGETHPRHAVRFTGVCTEPLIRPSLVIDDETLEILLS